MGFLSRLFKRTRKTDSHGGQVVGPVPPAIQLPEGSDVPDAPRSIGYKMAWIAVSSNSTNDVAQLLGLTGARPCNWEAGVNCVYENMQAVFVTPPVGGWVLAIGIEFANAHSIADRVSPVLNRLSTQFGEAQFFATHRGVDTHYWGKSRKGQIVRGFGYCGAEGETAWDVGDKTPEEVSKGWQFFDERSPEVDSHPDYWGREDLTYPDESMVMELAASWSLDPTTIAETYKDPGLGIIGIVMPPNATRREG